MYVLLESITSTIVCELPELGHLNRAEIAKLVGVAPMLNQTGKSDKKRRVRGGRSILNDMVSRNEPWRTSVQQEEKKRQIAPSLN